MAFNHRLLIIVPSVDKWNWRPWSVNSIRVGSLPRSALGAGQRASSLILLRALSRLHYFCALPLITRSSPCIYHCAAALPRASFAHLVLFIVSVCVGFASTVNEDWQKSVFSFPFPKVMLCMNANPSESQWERLVFCAEVLKWKVYE